MRGEARIDQINLLRFGIVHRELAAGARHGSNLRRRLARSVLAPRRIVGGAQPRSEPYTSVASEHRIMNRDVGIPDRFFAPEGRRLERFRLSRSIRVAIRHLDPTGFARYWVEHRKRVAALF